MASSQSQSPTSKLRSLEVPPVGQEDAYLFNLTPLLPPVAGNHAPVVAGNSDDDVVTISPPVALVAPLVTRTKDSGTLGVPTLWQEDLLADAKKLMKLLSSP